MARKFTASQLYRFPILMGTILGGIFTFYYSFSSVNHDRIKLGSKKFTDAPQVNFQVIIFVRHFGNFYEISLQDRTESD